MGDNQMIFKNYIYMNIKYLTVWAFLCEITNCW